jgi:hypothetical protein
MVTEHCGKLNVTLLYVAHWGLRPLQTHFLAYENFKLFLLGRVTSFVPALTSSSHFSASMLSSEVYFTGCDLARASVKPVCRC